MPFEDNKPRTLAAAMEALERAIAAILREEELDRAEFQSRRMSPISLKEVERRVDLPARHE